MDLIRCVEFTCDQRERYWTLHRAEFVTLEDSVCFIRVMENSMVEYNFHIRSWPTEELSFWYRSDHSVTLRVAFYFSGEEAETWSQRLTLTPAPDGQLAVVHYIPNIFMNPLERFTLTVAFASSDANILLREFHLEGNYSGTFYHPQFRDAGSMAAGSSGSYGEAPWDYERKEHHMMLKHMQSLEQRLTNMEHRLQALSKHQSKEKVN